MNIRIDWPEKKTNEIYSLEEILEIYTPKEIESGFLGNLEGDARFILQCDSGHAIFEWKNALKPFMGDFYA